MKVSIRILLWLGLLTPLLFLYIMFLDADSMNFFFAIILAFLSCIASGLIAALMPYHFRKETNRKSHLTVLNVSLLILPMIYQFSIWLWAIQLTFRFSTSGTLISVLFGDIMFQAMICIYPYLLVAYIICCITSRIMDRKREQQKEQTSKLSASQNSKLISTNLTVLILKIITILTPFLNYYIFAFLTNDMDEMKELYPDTYNFMYSVRDGMPTLVDYTSITILSNGDVAE